MRGEMRHRRWIYTWKVDMVAVKGRYVPWEVISVVRGKYVE